MHLNDCKLNLFGFHFQQRWRSITPKVGKQASQHWVGQELAQNQSHGKVGKCG